MEQVEDGLLRCSHQPGTRSYAFFQGRLASPLPWASAGLMDAGVGAFVFAGGLVRGIAAASKTPGRRLVLRKELLRAGALLGLGTHWSAWGGPPRLAHGVRCSSRLSSAGFLQVWPDWSSLRQQTTRPMWGSTVCTGIFFSRWRSSGWSPSPEA
jgi:hypothetical protein